MLKQILIVLALFVQAVSARDIVVFVHGLAGFGPDELGPIAYWQYRTRFPSSHFITYEATVGPVSSNWDRACELYAQIKGTRVDYGKAHSDRYGHERYGKDYTGQGFYPSWSTSNRNIHLVGHSMGGMTIRLLEILLQEGDSDEQSETGSSTSPLFTGQGNMIKSITTFSTPHDGTPLVDQLDTVGILDIIENLILGFAGVSTFTPIDNLYDFDLDHWGIVQNEGESFSSYWNRVKNSNIFDEDNDDLAPFDLSPAGAKRLNDRGQQTYPNTYYFAYATEQTWKDIFGYANPEIDMWFFLHPFASLIGRNSNRDWRTNDGLVPVESSQCPRNGNGYGGCTENRWWYSWQPNRWYYEEKNYDHLQIIGFTFGYYFIVDNIYSDHAAKISRISDSIPSLGIGVFDDETGGITTTGIYVILAVTMMVGAMFVSAITYKRTRATERLAKAMEDYMTTPDERTASVVLTEFANRRQSSVPSVFNSRRLSSIPSIFNSPKPRAGSALESFSGSPTLSASNPAFGRKLPVVSEIEI